MSCPIYPSPPSSLLITTVLQYCSKKGILVATYRLPHGQVDGREHHTEDVETLLPFLFLLRHISPNARIYFGTFPNPLCLLLLRRYITSVTVRQNRKGAPMKHRLSLNRRWGPVNQGMLYLLPKLGRFCCTTYPNMPSIIGYAAIYAINTNNTNTRYVYAFLFYNGANP